MTGTLFIVSAASGTGKTSLVARLLLEEPTLNLSVSYTTRAPREGEMNGGEYHFVDTETFEAMIKANDFLEYASIYGNYYGTSLSAIEKQLQADDVLVEIDWQGARQVVERIETSVVSIFILPPSMAVLEERLRNRAKDDDATITKRLLSAKEEIAQAAFYDYVMINDDFEEASIDLRSIIRANRLQMANYQDLWQQLI